MKFQNFAIMSFRITMNYYNYASHIPDLPIIFIISLYRDIYFSYFISVIYFSYS